MATSGEILVDTTATLVYTPGTTGDKERATIRNMGATNNIEISHDSGVTYGNGLPIKPGESYTCPVETRQPLYAVTTSAKQSSGSGTRWLVEPTGF